MTPGAWTSQMRWRAFADAAAAALGVNVWVSVVLLPGFFSGAWSQDGAELAAAAPLAVLAAGLWRRSEAILLLAFPVALLLPAAVAPEIAAQHVYGPIRLSIVAAGLVAYLFGASALTSFRENVTPVKRRLLSSARAPMPPRWRRRFRVYRGLAALSVVFPAALLYSIEFDPDNRAFLREMYPGRAGALTAALDLAAIGAWIAVYVNVFLGILRPHRTGDSDLADDLARIRARARLGRPRPLFYVSVAAALVLTLALLLLRSA